MEMSCLTTDSCSLLPAEFFVVKLLSVSSSFVLMKTLSMAVQGVFLWMQACVVLQLCLSHVPRAAASETSRNYYKTLNVEPTASDSQIKKAFRKLAVKYHPDKNKSVDAEKTFREIAEAYKVLSDKEKRKLYDNAGHAAFLQEEEASYNSEDRHESSFHFSFADFFNEFDENPFVEEEIFHWSFQQDWEDEGGSFEHFSFVEPGFSFFYEDGDENEETHHN
ncbi:dnaJ homolog subfamily B member 9-like [Notolabrus celidotus]|uniref:dnaJ homolog subfamily B member 9-like n=1 Tax=Notolabrus celidotus TaxID=1203425 RepID=UPI00148F7524|nr:dnaJ homolog subfamily B member 9-like [Notolabrus celidotus]